MRNASLLAIPLLLINSCMDMRMFPEGGTGAYDPDHVYHTGINGQGIEVLTWITTEYRTRAATHGRTNVDDPMPLLVEAAQRVAKLNCPSNYLLIDESSFSDFSYTMRYVCGE